MTDDMAPPPADVFISHSGDETAAARALAEALKIAGLPVWIDVENLRPGDRWMATIENAIEQARAFVIYVGARGVRKWVDAELRIALERNLRDRTFKVIPVLGPGARLDDLPPFLKQYQVSDCRAGLGDLSELRTLLATLSDADQALPAMTGSPFRGLLYFDVDDSLVFFGREPETEDLLARLHLTRFLAVIGDSGCGKSSLVRAGLVPALHRGRLHEGGSWIPSWRVAVLRPGESPLRELAKAIPGLGADMSPAERTELISEVAAGFAANRQTLDAAIAAVVPRGVHSLVVVDQFEEVFTAAAWSVEHDKFISELLAASSATGEWPIHVIVVLRADFFDQCFRHNGLVRRISDSQYLVSRIDATRLRHTIEKPLALYGTDAEAGLIDTILYDVGDEPGNLPLLQHALSQLWERRTRNRLTHDAYEDIGRLAGALRNHADDVYDHRFNEHEKALAREIFSRLVHPGNGSDVSRRVVRRSELLSLDEDRDAVMHVLDELIGARLVVTRRVEQQEETDNLIEVSHEALIREWPRLNAWLAEDREALLIEQRLFRLADEWLQSRRDSGVLLRGARLLDTEEWERRRPTPLPDPAQEFLQASIEARDDDDRRDEAARRAEKQVVEDAKRLARRTVAFSTALVLFFVVLASFTWNTMRQRRVAESRVLAADALQLVFSDPVTALARAIQAVRTARTLDAESALAEVLMRPSVRHSLLHEGEIVNVAAAANGSRIATLDIEGRLTLWDTATGEALHRAERGAQPGAKRVWLDRNGERVLTANGNGSLRFWDGRSSNARTFSRHRGPVYDAAFSPKGDLVATAGADGTLRLWSLRDTAEVRAMTGHRGAITRVMFSADGSRILSVGEDKTPRLWDADTGELVRVFDDMGTGAQDAAFATQGGVITAGDDGVARLWSRDGGTLERRLEGHRNAIVRVDFSEDGARAITAGRDGTARIWSTRTGLQEMALDASAGTVVHAAFSPGASHVVTVSEDGAALIWDVSTGEAILAPEHAEVLHAGFLGAASSVYTSGRASATRIWDLRDKLEHNRAHESPVQHVSFSPDGRMVASAELGAAPTVWDADTGEEVHRLVGHEGSVFDIAFSSDGQSIVTASRDRTARIWSTETGREIAKLEGADGFRVARFSPRGIYVATGDESGIVRIWDSASFDEVAMAASRETEARRAAVVSIRFDMIGEKLLISRLDGTASVWTGQNDADPVVLRGHDGALLDARFSPDGGTVVTTGRDGTARLWKTETGLEVDIVSDERALAAAFSPDGRHVAIARNDGTTLLWDVRDQRRLRALRGHRGSVHAVDFSPRESRLATAGDDGTVRVWDIETGQTLYTYRTSTPVLSVQYSSDGSRVLSRSSDGRARVYLATLEKLMLLAGQEATTLGGQDF